MEWMEIVQTVGIMCSIFFALWQIRVQTRQIRSATNVALASTVDGINRLLFEHPEIFPEFDKPYPTDGTSQEGDRRHHLMHLILNAFEQAFQQHKLGFVDHSAWQSWIRTMQEILSKPYAQGQWQVMKPLHTKEFQRFVEELRGRGQVGAAHL